MLLRDEVCSELTEWFGDMRGWEEFLGDNEKIVELYTHPLNPKYDPETGEPLIDGYPLFSGLPHSVKELTETDLILILEVLIDSYDDTNRGFLEYQAMYKNSPMRKARIDGMKRMVDKHTHAIEIIEAILRKAQDK